MAQVAIPLSRVLEATGGAVVRGQAGEPFSSVTIDSRAASAGALFFAVKGDRFDGHDFALSAVAAGARGVVVARGRGAALDVDTTIIEVDDTVKALGQLGQAHRMAMTELKVVAITGSNGKTTTKEMVASILSSSAGADRVLKTEGNLNNHLGVPLTLLRLHEEHRFAVVEMGMSGLGEIAYLTELARPDVAAIVSIGPVHLEQLGSISNVAKAKAEIFSGLALEGTAVYPAEEKLLANHVGKLSQNKLTFGPKSASPTVAYDEVQPGPTGLTLRLHLLGVTSAVGVKAHVPLIGRHNASNAAAAACVALALAVGEGSILEGLATVQPAKHRAQLMQVGPYTVLDDCYNAAPSSMRAALDALAEITPAGAKKIAVLGDMLELGAESAQLHADLGAYAAERADYLITMGPRSTAMNDAARPRLGDHMLHTEDPKDAADKICEVGKEGDVVLVKASRGMRLERVIDALAEVCERPRPNPEAPEMDDH